nr:hypothetical protein [Tanacetum cinerariifolium]
MGNEELNTIPKKESDEFIKSSVKDLILIPSESKDTSRSASECILPSCDDFSPINVFEEESVTFSNPLFNSNDDFTSSDDESLSDEDMEILLEPTSNKLLLDSDYQIHSYRVVCFETFRLDGDDDDDDYDKESIISTNTDIFETPSSIMITTSSPILPIEDPEDSLIMGKEKLNTILEKESDEFIKLSVEDLVPIPRESEDTSRSKSVYILPSCDDLSPIDILEEKDVTLSNPLFNSNDDFISSDDESLFDEDVQEDNVLENIRSKDSYDSNIDEPDLLVTPLFDANEDECFDSGGDVDKINGFEDGHYDSEGDILYLESLLSDDATLNLPPEVFLDRDLRSLSDAPISDLMIALDLQASRALGFVHRPLELQSLVYGNQIS